MDGYLVNTMRAKMNLSIFKKRPSLTYLKFIIWRKLKLIRLNKPDKKSILRLTFIFALVILSQIVILKYFKPGMASAWYNESWLYRKAIVVGNSGSEQTNKVVTVTVNTASLIDSGKLKSNCEDIRFTNSAGTLLDHRTKTGIRFQSADVELASASGTLITNTFTVPEARSNQILIAIVHATRSDQTAIGIDSVTFNGDTMTSAVTLDSQHSNRRLLSAVYYLANPDVGTELNLDVDLTNSAASRAVSTMLFTGVDLDNPILSSASDSRINNNSLPVTGTTSLSNSYIVGGFTREGGDVGAGRPVLDLPARQTYVSVESTGESDLQVAGGFMNAATNGSYTLTARTYKSGGGNTNWNGSWAELNEADCDNASTEFEVLMPTIANGDNTIYMYYGNSSASSIEATLTDSSRAIEYVRTTSVSDDDGGVSSTFSHHLCGSPNVCTATDRVLVVLIHAQTSSEPGIGHIDALSVNYNGDPLKKQAFKDFDDTRYQTTEVWMLKNPDEGNYSVEVQFSLSTNAYAIAAMTFENVEQKFYFHEVDDDGASPVTTQTLNFNTSLDDSVLVGGAMRRILNDWQVDVDSPGTATYDIDQTDDLNRTVIEASGGYQEAASAGVHSIDFSISGGTSSGAELMTSAGIALQPETDYDDFTPTSGPILGSEESQSPHAIFLKFDEGVDDSCPSGKDACDSGLEENDATHSASLMWKNEDMCASGKCLFFDGTSNFLTVSNTGSIDLNDSLADNFTISTWVRVNSDGEGSVGEIFDKGGTTYLRTTNEGSDGYADLEASLDLGTAGSTNDATVTITNGINLNRWHHIAVTYADDADDEITIYIDGVNRGASINGSGAPATDTSDLLIGGSSGANFHGFIDEFKIYYTERTAAQIKLETQLESTYEGTSASFGGNQKYLSDGLVGYWNLNEGTGTSTTDVSGNNFTGTLTNSPTWGVGKYDDAVVFANSTNLITAGDQTTLELNTFTHSAWVYRTGTCGASTYCTALSKGGSSSKGYKFGLRASGGNYFVDLTLNDTQQVTGSTTQFATNTWYHIAAIANETSVKLYVNGVLEKEATRTETTLSFAGETFKLGNGNDGNDLPFEGRVDEVRVYKKVISASEIQDLYQLGPSPIAHWDFNENTGNIAYDRSGSGTDLTLTSTDTPLPKRKPGKYGGALDYDGSTDYAIDSTPGSGLGITGDLTVAAWVYRESTTDDDTIIDRSGNSTGSADNVNYQFYINDTDNILRLFWESGSEVAETVSSTVAITNSTNTWVHLSATRDITSNEVRFYENGVQLGAAVTYTNDPSGGGTSPSVSLGRRVETAYGYFDGAIDDVKVYNYVRNTQQLVQDMNGNHPAPGSPVGSAIQHFKFDEGYGDTANNAGSAGSTFNMNLSGGTSCPDISGCPSWSDEGKFGKSLNFDGSDYAEISDLTFNPTDVTISAWIKTSTTMSDNDIVSRGSGGGIPYTLRIVNDKLRFIISDGTNSPYVDSTTSSNTGNWIHVVGVRNTAQDKLYIFFNGKLENSATDTTTGSTASSTDSDIGQRVSGGNRYTGLLDELKIYNQALTPSQINLLYNQSSSSVWGAASTDASGNASFESDRSYCPPGDTTASCAPAGEWKFDENSGLKAYDTSEGEFNGTLTNMDSKANWVPGVIGSALNFTSSTDSVEVGTGPLNIRTISFWVNPSTATEAFIYLKGSDGDGTEKFIYASGGSVTAQNFSSPTIYINGVLSSTITINEWQHILVTTTTAINANKLRLGCTGDSSCSTSLVGKMDQIRLFDYAFNTSQVAWEYNHGKPLAHYKFDECTSTIAYDSGNKANTSVTRYDGTITPGSSGNTSAGTCGSGTSTEMWNDGTNGKMNGSLGFDGTDDYVVINDTANLRFDSSTADFSLFAWIKRTTTGIEYIISKEDADNDGYRLQFNSSNQVLCSEDATDVTSTQTITDTNWHHIGCTIDRDGNGQVYIDGKPNGTAVSMGTDPMLTSSNIRIGTRSYTSTYYFNGLIDDIRIFNYALTNQQIKTIMNDGAIRFAPLTGSPQ